RPPARPQRERVAREHDAEQRRRQREDLQECGHPVPGSRADRPRAGRGSKAPALGQAPRLRAVCARPARLHTPRPAADCKIGRTGTDMIVQTLPSQVSELVLHEDRLTIRVLADAAPTLAARGDSELAYARISAVETHTAGQGVGYLRFV